jgi:hypothetical protein
MVYVNDGIEEIQTIAIRGGSGNTPTYMIYAGSDNTYTGRETEINDEITFSSLTWERVGINSKYRTMLNSTEAAGSYIGTYGIATGSSTVNNNLHVIQKSFIGNKDLTFNVQLEGEIIMRRPNA